VSSNVSSDTTRDTLAHVDELVAAGQALDAIDVLRRAHREAPDDAFEIRLAELRYEAFKPLVPQSVFATWPVPVSDIEHGPARIPEITRAELDADAVRRGILGHGSLLVRNLLDAEQVARFASGIDRAIAVRGEGPDGPTRNSSWYVNLPLPREEATSLGRHWISASGGLPAADSPKMLNELFETYEAIGLKDVVGGYLGERPVLSANKCTLRRVPLTSNTDWHQDGAFLGKGIRALNVWVALTDCGVDAPGMDLLPRRFDQLAETGTGGAIFDWAVGPSVVEALAVETPIVRPEFRAGDALFFDDMFLHRTAIEPTMTQERHAIEAWFFAPSGYPEGQVPLVW
jgi:hypothetical protein